MGKLDETLALYKTAIELAPEDIFVYYQLGKTYLEHKLFYIYSLKKLCSALGNDHGKQFNNCCTGLGQVKFKAQG